MRVFVCIYCYSVWVVSKSTVVKSFIILLPTAVIIETDCGSKAWLVQGLAGPSLGGSMVNTYLHYYHCITSLGTLILKYFNEAINMCVMFRKRRQTSYTDLGSTESAGSLMKLNPHVLVSVF